MLVTTPATTVSQLTAAVKGCLEGRSPAAGWPARSPTSPGPAPGTSTSAQGRRGAPPGRHVPGVQPADEVRPARRSGSRSPAAGSPFTTPAATTSSSSRSSSPRASAPPNWPCGNSRRSCSRQGLLRPAAEAAAAAVPAPGGLIDQRHRGGRPRHGGTVRPALAAQPNSSCRASRVQGDGAAAEIAAALGMLNHVHATRELPLDAIVLGRGGGSSSKTCGRSTRRSSPTPCSLRRAGRVGRRPRDRRDHRRPGRRPPGANPDRGHRGPVPGPVGVVRRPPRAGRPDAGGHAPAGRRPGGAAGPLAARPAIRKPLDRLRTLEQKLDDTAARLRAARTGVERKQDKLAAGPTSCRG